MRRINNHFNVFIILLFLDLAVCSRFKIVGVHEEAYKEKFRIQGLCVDLRVLWFSVSPLGFHLVVLTILF